MNFVSPCEHVIDKATKRNNRKLFDFQISRYCTFTLRGWEARSEKSIAKKIEFKYEIHYLQIALTGLSRTNFVHLFLILIECLICIKS